MMKTLPIKDATKFYRQEIIDIAKNILIRTYHLENGFGFRFISFKDGSLYDPMCDSDNFNWVYGPIKHSNEVRNAAFNLYMVLNQK